MIFDEVLVFQQSDATKKHLDVKLNVFLAVLNMSSLIISVDRFEK